MLYTSEKSEISSADDTRSGQYCNNLLVSIQIVRRLNSRIMLRTCEISQSNLNRVFCNEQGGAHCIEPLHVGSYLVLTEAQRKCVSEPSLSMVSLCQVNRSRDSFRPPRSVTLCDAECLVDTRVSRPSDAAKKPMFRLVPLSPATESCVRDSNQDFSRNRVTLGIFGRIRKFCGRHCQKATQRVFQTIRSKTSIKHFCFSA